MIDILQTKSGITKFQILIEVAAHQPTVRQKEIAEKIGVTPQAVSEYIKELTAEGYIYSDGRVRYRITKKGVEWVLENASDMKKYANFVMSDIISHVSTWTAIADENLEKGEQVFLHMRKGLLYVSKNDKVDVILLCSGSPTKPRMSDPMMAELDVENGKIEVNFIEVEGNICEYVNFSRTLNCKK